MSDAAIEFRTVTKRFDAAAKPAVDRLDLEIRRGETVALIGASGCGKTTTLKMINRLIEPTSGTILVTGKDVHEIPVLELRRSLGYVIQQVGLFPHMTVASNIAVVPQLLGWDRQRIAARVDELLTLVHLPPAEYRHRRPVELSGGQQQRVGVARALAADPPILLMDEPFGALDPITRASLQCEVLEIQRKLRKAIVIVTHDMEEAIRLGDRIVVMEEGRIAQSGTPAELLMRPATPFVASLLGEDRAIKLLQTMTVGDLMSAGRGDAPADAPRLDRLSTLHDALGAFLASGRSELVVTDEAGTAVGRLARDRLFELQGARA
jgi:osmoprotectant transport system ATP-binding protein